jgi:sodium/proline symporter
MNAIAISFIIYTLIIVSVGIYSSRFSKQSSADFFLANRGLGAWVAGLSSSASAESGWVTLGLVGIAFKTGLAALWIIPGTVAAFLFNWIVLAKRLRQRSEQYDAITVPDILASPYRGVVAVLIRALAILIILSMLTAYVAAQLNAAGKTFNATFDMNYFVGVLVGAGIVLIYTVTGGFRAVAWTDVIQGSFMIIALIVIPLILMAKVGGPLAVIEALREADPSGNLLHPFAGKTGMALVGFMAVWFGVPLGNPGQPHVLVRLMAIKDEQAIRRATIISSTWVAMLFFGAVALGICARAYYGTLADPEKALPTAAADPTIVPGVVGGLIIAAILAAICSTADSQLLVSASAVSHDAIARLFGKEIKLRNKVILDRCAVLLIGGIAIAIAMAEVGPVFTFVLDYGWAGLGAGFGPALIFSLLWKRTTGWGVFAGMVVGVATAMIWKQFPDLQAQLYNLVPAFFFSCVTIIAVSLIFPDSGDPSPVEDKQDN